MSAGLSVIVAGDDLFFSTRIASALTSCGHRPRLVSSLRDFHAALTAGPDAAILNLASHRLDSVAAIRLAKADPVTRAIPLLGFCGHADAPRQAAARAAGCDLVATNGAVAGNLPRLLEELLAATRATP